ncbi:hypothetical protein BGZ98_001080 [Dissophora globulifera]|nr:hypothetical protein BGZ98_001080 [Dissophora globulifera]
MPNKDCTMKVHPFVGFIKEPIENIDTIAFNKDEVHKVFTMPIQDLIDPEKKSMVRFRNSKTLYPVWNVEQEDITIWGLTAFILDGVLQQIAKEGPTDAIKIPEGARVGKYEPSEPSTTKKLKTEKKNLLTMIIAVNNMSAENGRDLRVFEIEVWPTTTIDDIREKLRQFGLTRTLFAFYHNGRKLRKGYETLADRGIGLEDVIHCDIYPLLPV